MKPSDLLLLLTVLLLFLYIKPGLTNSEAIDKTSSTEVVKMMSQQ